MLTIKGAYIAAAFRKSAPRTKGEIEMVAHTHRTSLRHFAVDVANPANCRNRIRQIIPESGRIDVMAYLVCPFKVFSLQSRLKTIFKIASHSPGKKNSGKLPN